MGEDRTGATGADRRRLTVPQAAEALGVTVDAVRGRIRRGKLEAEHDAGGVHVWIDVPEETDSRGPSATSHGPSTGQAERIEDLREQVAYLREQLEEANERDRENRRIIAALTSRIPALEAPQETTEAPETVEEEPERAKPHSATEGVKKEMTHSPAPSAPTSRTGLSTRALATSGIATLLTWSSVLIWNRWWNPFLERWWNWFLWVPLVMLVPLVAGLWAGSTKRPSLPWFSSPLRWLRRDSTSVLKIGTVAASMPASAGFLIAFTYFAYRTPSLFNENFTYWWELVIYWGAFILTIAIFGLLLAIPFSLLPFMSGTFLGNALRRVGFLGAPKQPPPGEEDTDMEQEEVWTRKKEVQWGVMGTIASAVLSAVLAGIFAVLVAMID